MQSSAIQSNPKSLLRTRRSEHLHARQVVISEQSTRLRMWRNQEQSRALDSNQEPSRAITHLLVRSKADVISHTCDAG